MATAQAHRGPNIARNLPVRGRDSRKTALPTYLGCAEIEQNLDSLPIMVRRFFVYWRDIRGSADVPRRRDFYPLDIPRHLSGIMLLDVEHNAPKGRFDFRYRVVGEKETEARRHNPTGRLVEDGYYGPSKEEALGDYETVRSTGMPFYKPVRFLNDRKVQVDEHSLIVPFSKDGRTPHQLLVYSEKRESAAADRGA